jgi:HAD superfamily hydrolase (TIGR01509 family)
MRFVEPMKSHSPLILAVAFDLDGLMFDSEALSFRVVGDMLRSRGKALTREMKAVLIGRRTADSGEAFRNLAGLEESVESIMAELRERFYSELDTAVHPTAGLFALLDRLEHRKLPRCVATSSRRSYAEGMLTRHRLIHRFSFLLGSEDVTQGKPDPEIYRTAAERFGIEPARMLVLEDSPSGVSAAKAAGAFAVGVPHEHSPADGLRHADRLVSRLDDPALFALLSPVSHEGLDR